MCFVLRILIWRVVILYVCADRVPDGPPEISRIDAFMGIGIRDLVVLCSAQCPILFLTGSQISRLPNFWSIHTFSPDEGAHFFIGPTGVWAREFFYQVVHHFMCE